MSGQLRFQGFGKWISIMFLWRQHFMKNKSNTSTSPLVPVQNKALATNTQKQLYAMYSCIVISSVDTILFTNRAILEITREFKASWKGIWTHYFFVVNDNSYVEVVRQIQSSVLFHSFIPAHPRCFLSHTFTQRVTATILDFFLFGYLNHKVGNIAHNHMRSAYLVKVKVPLQECWHIKRLIIQNVSYFMKNGGKVYSRQ